jgi:hypothetical protein
MALNIKRDGSVVEEENLPCPFYFLEVEIRVEEKLASKGRETDCVTGGIEHQCHKKQLQEKGTGTDCT